MPRRIPDERLSTSVFMYPTPDEARMGRPTGGSAFFVSVPWESETKYVHVYAVTNRHVIRPKKGDGALVMRLNLKSGGTDIIETKEDEWQSPASGDDIAVRQCFPDQGKFECGWDKVETIVTEEIIALHNLGIGDDVYSYGRFLDVDNGAANRPVMRFGHVAAMPPVPVLVEPGKYQDSYLVEMRSRTGFSGSAVYILFEPQMMGEFVDRPIHRTLGEGLEALQKLKIFGPWILGIHWGQMPVVGPDAFDMELRRPASYGSGISAVVPGTRLREFLLEDENLKRVRKQVEDEWHARQHATQESAAETVEPFRQKDSVAPESDNPSHKEDFKRLLNAAAKTKQ
jgi:hypothetical protein